MFVLIVEILSGREEASIDNSQSKKCRPSRVGITGKEVLGDRHTTSAQGRYATRRENDSE